jgi:uncharacterized protein YcfJ
MRNLKRRAVLSVVLTALAGPLLLLMLGGCQSNAETGALIGAGAGAAGGYIIGNEMDKEDNRHHR